jgi:hypothetical protein
MSDLIGEQGSWVWVRIENDSFVHIALLMLQADAICRKEETPRANEGGAVVRMKNDQIGFKRGAQIGPKQEPARELVSGQGQLLLGGQSWNH